MRDTVARAREDELPPRKLSAGQGPGSASRRPRALGKFLYSGSEKRYVRGVTYGTFQPDEAGCDYPDPSTVALDFSLMAAHGINAVRTYTVPPRWLLDCAQDHGLSVMVGLPWEQHITFLDDPGRPGDIERRVREGVRACAGHPAVLCYAIGNEIPASIVRWHGARRVERFLERLYRAVKAEDPGALTTYVNFPTTEYLELPFLDIVTFNVYLESQRQLERYLSRLQNLAGERPLILAEIGLDSRRGGEATQARVLDWQIRTTFAAGCAGAFVFAWTDEWHRGGYDVGDWDFGLTRRDRGLKPALSTVREAYAQVPFPALRWPRVSVVVCTYNGGHTLGGTLEALAAVDYPDYEVIVVDDGSSDDSAEIAAGHDVRLIRTPNRGLSAARNTGLDAATGEIVVYIDDDAFPDRHWLQYLAAAFRHTKHAAIGGPNIAPDDDGLTAECVANAPGGPTHVLLDDEVAEHIPGCNMAFRRAALLEIGGFDPQFRAAGDDVDICWRVQQRGWTVGYTPAAAVWHHRRCSARGYWSQQIGYGKAEALLERKWPEKYNSLGHVSWGGRIYGKGVAEAIAARRGRIYRGTWGSAPFQAVYAPAPGLLAALPLMPEWYLLVVGLGVLSLTGFGWHPLWLAAPLLAAAVGAPVLQALLSARAALALRPRARSRRVAFFALTAALFLVQPVARLRGRVQHGLTPWRQRFLPHLAVPRRRSLARWSEQWRSPDHWLGNVEARLRATGVVVARGGDFDDWDLHIRGGLLGAARVRLVIEEHGGGKQLVRLRVWPRCSYTVLAAAALLAALAVGAAFAAAWGVVATLSLLAASVLIAVLRECAMATGNVIHAFNPAPSPAAVTAEVAVEEPWR